MSMREVQEAVESGKQQQWREAVGHMLRGRAPNEIGGFQIQETYIIGMFLVEADQNGDGFYIHPVPLTTEKPYERIASLFKETSTGMAFPVGLLFLGQKNGQWMSGECLIGLKHASEAIERPLAEIHKIATKFALRYANRRIREIGGLSSEAVHIVTDIPTGEKSVLDPTGILDRLATKGKPN
jgi:hypothetical protein